jgi:hypothetical protein
MRTFLQTEDRLGGREGERERESVEREIAVGVRKNRLFLMRLL